jgi:hypothetical protein
MRAKKALKAGKAQRTKKALKVDKRRLSNQPQANEPAQVAIPPSPLDVLPVALGNAAFLASKHMTKEARADVERAFRYLREMERDLLGTTMDTAVMRRMREHFWLAAAKGYFIGAHSGMADPVFFGLARAAHMRKKRSERPEREALRRAVEAAVKNRPLDHLWAFAGHIRGPVNDKLKKQGHDPVSQKVIYDCLCKLPPRS